MDTREIVSVDILQEIVSKYEKKREYLLSILSDIKKTYQIIDTTTILELSELMDISPSEIYGVMTFYSFLGEKKSGRFVIRLCKTLSCDFAGKENIADALRRKLNIDFGETTEDGLFTLEWTNCMGMCDLAPAMMVNDWIFVKVTPESVIEILEVCKKNIDSHPLRIEQFYINHNREDYKSLTFSEIKNDFTIEKILNLKREEIIGEIRESGLRGRGGAGFPTGVKWNLAAATASEEKFVVCNADEGEPGTFKDRIILIEFPELVIDGMTIAAYAIGAQKGILYLRGEYTFLKSKIEDIIDRRNKNRLLGKEILGRNFSFDIEVRMGCGAYVCGEESALIESIEGKRGEARNRPPFPVTKGINDKPTIVNNVETFAWIPVILTKGWRWFYEIGTEKSKGLKLLSVSGDVRKTGIYEIPFGIKIGEVLDRAGAVDPQAVIVGGASGKIVFTEEFNRTISYEDISTGGSFIVIGKDRDLFTIMLNICEFFREESCGQCTPCRIGNERIYEILKNLKNSIQRENIQKILILSKIMQRTSKCGLGQSSTLIVNSVISRLI